MRRLTVPPEAVAAAAVRLREEHIRHGVRLQADVRRIIVSVVLEAAAPLIAAAERDRILALHKPVDRGRVMRCCEGCESVNGEFHEDCCHEWPCPTVELLAGDQP